MELIIGGYHHPSIDVELDEPLLAIINDYPPVN